MSTPDTWNYLAPGDVGVTEQLQFFPEYREQDTIYDIVTPYGGVTYLDEYFDVVSTKYTTEETKRFFKDQINLIVGVFNSPTLGSAQEEDIYNAMIRLNEFMKAANPALLSTANPTIQLTSTSAYGQLGLPTHKMVDAYRRIVNSYAAHASFPVDGSVLEHKEAERFEPWIRSEHTKEILVEAVNAAYTAEVGYIRNYLNSERLGEKEFNNKEIDSTSKNIINALVTGYVDENLNFIQTSNIATNSLQEIVKTEFVREGYDQIVGAMAELKDAIELNSEILGALNEFQFLMNQKEAEQWSLAFNMLPIYQDFRYVTALAQQVQINETGSTTIAGGEINTAINSIASFQETEEGGSVIFDFFKQLNLVGANQNLVALTGSEDDLFDKLYEKFEKASFNKDLMPQVKTITVDIMDKINDLHNKWVQDYTFDAINLQSPNGTIFSVPDFSGSNLYGPYENPDGGTRDLYFVSPDPAGTVRRGTLTSLQGSLLGMRHELVKLSTVDNNGNVSYPSAFEPLTNMINDIQATIDRRVQEEISVAKHRESLDLSKDVPDGTPETYEYDLLSNTEDRIGTAFKDDYLTQREVLYENLVDAKPVYDSLGAIDTTDKYGDPITMEPSDDEIIELIYWIGDNKDGVEGTHQRHLTQSIGSTQAFSTEQREELRTEMLRFEEFLKASASIAAKITSIIEKIASSISR